MEKVRKRIRKRGGGTSREKGVKKGAMKEVKGKE